MVPDNKTYQEFADAHMGGVDPKAIEQFFYWNDPFELKHWSMNVVELLMIGGALLALAHAILTYRNNRNPAHLCLWFASVLYFLMVEPVLYFPELLGVKLPIYFTHNEFTAGLFYNRAPFYILMLYPALLYPCFELVRQAGIFNRYGVWLGALCVGFVHSVFYEIFDHIGPQFTWWAWNYDEPTIHLRLGSVPLSSILLFSLLPPFAFSVLASSLLFKETPNSTTRTVTGWLWRTWAVAVLVPVATALPSLMFSAFVIMRLTLVAEFLCYGTLLVFAIVALRIFSRKAEAESNASNTAGSWIKRNYPSQFLFIYLITFAGLWVFALGDILDSKSTQTPPVDLVCSLPYVAFCFVVGVYLVVCSFKVMGFSGRYLVKGMQYGD